MKRNLGTVRDLLTQSGGPPIDLMGRLGGKARSAAALLSESAEETIGSIMTTVHANTKWLDSKAMRKALAASDFSLRDLNKGDTTIYVVNLPQYIHLHARMMRLFLNQVVSAAVEGRKDKYPTLVVCDETYAIGPLAIMQKAAGIIRGYGVRLWWILQNMSQLVEMYPRNWETFFATSGQQQFFSINDKAGAQYLSEMIGKCRVWAKKKMRDAQGRVVGTEWEPVGTAPVCDATEAARLVSREGGLEVVIREGAPPFLLRRVNYDKHFSPDMYAPDPFEPGSRSWRREARSLVRRARMKLMEAWQ
jgi:type IV secretion system protein VirD4